MSVKYYQIDEVAKLTNLTKRTIRYYEDMELFKPVRTDAGYRLYSEDDVSIIKEIKDLRVKLGLTLTEVKQILGLKSELIHIFDDKYTELSDVEKVLDRVTSFYNLLSEKEEILKNVKHNCKNHIDKLDLIIKEKKLDK